MDAASSWFRRSISNLKKSSLPSSSSTVAAACTNKKLHQEQEDTLYGITEQLIEFIKSFTLQTFRNFSLPEEEESAAAAGNSGSVSADLSEWQESHAMVVLSRVKELGQLRFQLCPRYLKERQFWRIYFTLVRSYVAEYELRAVRLAKLKQIRMGNETVSNSSACEEIEMSEAKFTESMESETFMEQK